MAPRTLFAKLWDAHRVAALPGGADLISIDRVFLHERTGSIALKSLAERGLPVVAPAHVFCAIDHIVDTRPGRGDETLVPGGRAFIEETRSAAKAAGLTLFDVSDPRQGIVHVISPEQGIVLPGLTLVCPDSHTSTQGAFGALAWGIGSSEAEHVLATGALRVTRPKTMRVRFSGALAPGVTAKDLALALISSHGAAGGAGHVIEFCGDAIEALDLAGRQTLCNMAAEFSAFSAIIAPDEKTFAALEGRPYAPVGELWRQALAAWRALHSDEGAVFDREVEIDAAAVAPMVTWGTSPEHAAPISGNAPGGPSDAYARAFAYMDLEPGAPLEGLAIDAAFIGSCTNSRIDDLRRAAAVLKGRKVAPGVKAICVPGSSSVKRQAEAEGLDAIFKAAGFEWRESGCSMCFFAGGEGFGLRERVVSSTNRNFEGRQGPQTRTHLASPETVAASAIAGALADVRKLAV